MKHAGKATLMALEPLLRELRAVPGLIDRVTFERLPVTTKAQQARLLERVVANLSAQR